MRGRHALLALWMSLFALPIGACDENRCAETARSVYEDSQVFRGCVGDQIRFLPSNIELEIERLDSSSSSSSGGTSNGEASSFGGDGMAPSTGGTLMPAILNPGQSQLVQLIAEGSSGWRRDHAQVELLLLPPPRCSSLPPPPRGPFPIRLVAVEGEHCRQTGQTVSCLTGPDGSAQFLVERLPGVSRSTTVFVCPTWGRRKDAEDLSNCLEVILGEGAPECPTCTDGGAGAGGCSSDEARRAP